jgi:hypothetical protein
MKNLKANKTIAKPGDYADKQAVDKSPGGERGKKEKVTPLDLKGKKVDADPINPDDQPAKE